MCSLIPKALRNLCQRLPFAKWLWRGRTVSRPDRTMQRLATHSDRAAHGLVPDPNIAWKPGADSIADRRAQSGVRLVPRAAALLPALEISGPAIGPVVGEIPQAT